jgi:uracil-DNA glycosylase
LGGGTLVDAKQLRDDGSYALASTEERAIRRTALNRPHISPLIAFVDRIRSVRALGDKIPYFDPCDGGVHADVLFLLEAPGARAVSSGFISRDNPDPSARNFRKLLAEAAIPRERSILWNIVPWYIGTDTRIRPATRLDIQAGAAYLPTLLGLLPELRAVVLVGRKAQRARGLVARLTKARIFELLHPSNQVVTCWPERRKEIECGLSEVAAFLKLEGRVQQTRS